MTETAATIELPAIVGIAEAAALRDRLVEALDGSGDLRLDLDATGRIDTAGLQLILSLERSLALLDRRLILSGDTALLREELAGLGLGDELELGGAPTPSDE